MSEEKYLRNADWLGIGFSSLCAIHCILTSFFMMSLPILARFYFTNPVIHLTLGLLIIPVGAFAFLRGYKSHKNFVSFVIGILGLLIVGGVPQLSHTFDINLNETGWLIFGSLLLIVGHIFNIRLRTKN